MPDISNSYTCHAHHLQFGLVIALPQLSWVKRLHEHAVESKKPNPSKFNTGDLTILRAELRYIHELQN